VGKHGGEFLTTPLGVVGAVLERIWVDKAIEMVRQGLRHFRRSAGAGTISQTLDPMMGKALDPFPQGGIGKVQRV
jgi:hypothetical protein